MTSTEVENSESPPSDYEEVEQELPSCKIDRGVPMRRYGDIPRSQRLIYPKGSKVDTVHSRTPKPHGIVPLQFMPVWPVLSTDAQIPVLPAPENTLETSRGQISEPLHRPVKDFTTTDPLNKEKVITSPYTALHDPNAKDHFHKPAVTKFIKDQNLLTSQGLVRATPKEFNDFRRYLSKRIYLSDVHATMDKADNIKKGEREQIQAIKKEINKNEGSMFKINEIQKRAKKLNELKMENRRVLQEAKNAYTDFRSQAHRQMLAETRAARLLQKSALEGITRTRLEASKAEDVKRRQSIARKLCEREIRATSFIQCERAKKEAERQEYLTDWLSIRCETQKHQLAQAEETKKTLNATLKQRAEKRQAKVEVFRANMTQRIEARMADERRIWALVRKYFYRWLNNVRQRKARRPDEFHRSFWQIKPEMEVTLKYLQKESGYEKLDDLIMNIVKLKRDIKADLDSESIPEAAVALGLVKPTRQDEDEYDEEAENDEDALELESDDTDLNDLT